MKTLFLFLVILICPFLSKGQWEKTNGPVKKVNVVAYAFKDNMVFAAAAFPEYESIHLGRVYRSDSKGDHWKEASFRLPLGTSFIISSLAVSAIYVYAGTDRGIWRSDDNGDHWVSITNGLPDTLIAYVGAAYNLVFAFTDNAVYRSDNYGLSWEVCFEWSSILHDYTSFFQIGSTLFFCDSYNGIYRSQDNGVSWEQIYPDTGCFLSMTALDSYIFATDCESVIRSGDNGSTWTVVTDSLLIWRMVAQGSSLFTGGYGYFYRSDDYGNSWTSITNGIPIEYINTMGADNSSVYVGSSSGNFRTDNKGIKWEKKVNGLPFDRINCIATKWANIYTGTNGGGIFHSTDFGLNWYEMNKLLTCTDVTSFAMNNYEMYAGTTNGIFISNTAGEHWVPYNNGLTVKTVNMIMSQPGILYSCTEGGGVFISPDDGLQWTTRNSGLSNLNVRCICSAGTSIFCGTHGGGIYRSDNPGNLWSASSAGITNNNINSLLYQGTKIFAGTHDGAFISSDNGSSWIDVSYGLLNKHINAFACVGKQVFAGTNKGVYRYSDNQSMWIKVSESLPDTIVTTLAASKTDLFAGIIEEGVWTRPLSDFSMLETDPGNLTLADTINSTDTISVIACEDWVIHGVLPDWLSLDKWTGTGNDFLVFRTLQKNEDVQKRSAGFTISSVSGLSAGFTVFQEGKTSGTGAISNSSLSVYPVPSTGKLQVENNLPIKEITVFDTNGNLIYRQQPGNNSLSLNLSAERKGIYYLRVLCAERIYTKKIVLL